MDEAAVAARSLLAMEVARRATTALAREGIEVMPLKGVLFVALGVKGSATRYVGDVDLLVRAERHGEAVRVLGGEGFREVARAAHAVTLWSDELGFHVDLHHRLFPLGWFRMETNDVLARATHVGGWSVMDAYDVYSHLVGHFVFGRHNADDARHVADFGAVVEHFGLEATECAARLEATGMGRAARYVMRETASGRHAEHARGILAALPRDAVGDGLAFVGHVMLGRYPRARLRGSGPAHLLGETVPRGLAALVRTAWDRGRHR